MPAAEWVVILLQDPLDLGEIFPGLVEEEVRDLVEDGLIEGAITFDEVETVALDIISTVGARPWYVVMRLLLLAQEIWDTHHIGGELAMYGVDASNMSLSAWLDAAQHIMVQHIDPKQLTMFYSKLEMPPAGVAPEQPEEMEMSRDAFMTLMSN